MSDESKKPLTNDEYLDFLAMLLPHEFEPLIGEAATKLKFRKSALIKEVERRRKFLLGTEDVNLAGKAVKLEDVLPWDQPVKLSSLLDEIARVLETYIIFQHSYDSWTLALWVVVTYCSELYNIAPLVGITAISKECGKTSLLRILLHLVRKGKPTINLTRATAFRIINKWHPTIVADEVDKFVKDDPQLLGIFLAGHEREFSVVTICVGDDHEERDFDVFGPKIWGQIGLPDEQLVSRSIVIQLLQKEAAQIVLDWPRIGMPPELDAMFIRLQRQCLRWMQDNTEKLKTNMPELSTLSNRCKDNWFPLYCIACMASNEWKERAIQGAEAISVIDELTPQITLVRDVRNIFHTHGLDRMPSWLLLQGLLLQTESPWKDFERQREGLNLYQLGHMIRELGIRSKTLSFDRQYVLFPKKDQDTTKLKGYELKDFMKLIDSHLAGDAKEIVPVYAVEPISKAA